MYNFAFDGYMHKFWDKEGSGNLRSRQSTYIIRIFGGVEDFEKCLPALHVICMNGQDESNFFFVKNGTYFWNWISKESIEGLGTSR